MFAITRKARPSTLLLILLLLAMACKKPGTGTFVHVQFEGTVSQEKPIYAIQLDLQLGQQHSSTSFTAPSNGAITLPTDGALEIQSGSGDLLATARALAKDGRLLGEGSKTGRVETGQTTTIEIIFSASYGDAGTDADNPAGDAGTTPDRPAEADLPTGGSGGADSGGTGAAAGTGGSTGSGSGGSAVGTTGSGGATESGGSAAGAVGNGGSAAGTTGTGGNVAGTMGNGGIVGGITGSGGSAAGDTGISGSTGGTTGTGGVAGGGVRTGGGTGGLAATGGSGGTSQTSPSDVFVLTIQFTGPGNGTVNGVTPACNSPGPCMVAIQRIDPGNPPKVVLTAQPDGTSQFGGWSGPCTGTGSCSLLMDGPKTVTAGFYVANTMQISLNVIGLAGQSGTIVSDDGSISCNGSCPNVSVPMSASLTFLAKADPNSTFAGWTGGGCRGTSPNCPLTVVDGMNVTATFGPQAYMFVSSSQIVPGKLGDVTAADSECQRLASKAGLPGSYAAWLATKEMAARARVGKGGWLRTDGRPFALNGDVLSARQVVYYPPRLDETGNDLGNAHNLVVTGGASDGTIADSQCAGFTSTSGDVAVGDTASGSFLWAKLQTDLDGCGRPYRIYCFRSDLAFGDLAPPPQPGRRMFVTAQPYIPTGGVAAADSLCQGEAKSANLTGQFLAFLSTSTTPAMQRISGNGPPWKRVDEVLLVRQIQDFSNGRLLAAPNVTADGKTYADFKVWTGSNTPNVVGTDTCKDWMASSDGVHAIVGASNTTASVDWFALGGGNGNIPCSDTNTHLLCIEP